jgi:hypothetical protein
MLGVGRRLLGTHTLACRVEQRGEGVVAVDVAPCEVTLDVFDGAREHVEPIPGGLKFFPGHYQFVLTQPELVRALAGFVVALLARRLAVEPGTAGSPAHRKRSPAPHARAPGHSEIVEPSPPGIGDGRQTAHRHPDRERYSERRSAVSRVIRTFASTA